MGTACCLALKLLAILSNGGMWDVDMRCLGVCGGAKHGGNEHLFDLRVFTHFYCFGLCILAGRDFYTLAKVGGGLGTRSLRGRTFCRLIWGQLRDALGDLIAPFVWRGLCGGLVRVWKDHFAARDAPVFPQVPRKLHILLKLSARHTSLNSALTLSSPLRLNCLNPSTLLIQPLGASTIHFLLR